MALAVAEFFRTDCRGYFTGVEFGHVLRGVLGLVRKHKVALDANYMTLVMNVLCLEGMVRLAEGGGGGAAWGWKRGSGAVRRWSSGALWGGVVAWVAWWVVCGCRVREVGAVTCGGLQRPRDALVTLF